MIGAFHGKGSDSGKAFIPWLKLELEKKGYETFTPNLSDSKMPSEKKWEEEILNTYKNNDLRHIVAYSLSIHPCLRLLESREIKPKKIFLVAPFQELNYEKEYDTILNLAKKLNIEDEWAMKYAQTAINNSKRWCKDPLPFDGLKKYQKKMHIFYSNNDPWVKPEQIELFKSKLPTANYHLEKGAGHFTTFDCYDKFPNLLEVILNNIEK